MKKGLLPNGWEVYNFGNDNTLKIFPPYTFKFKPKPHIAVDDIQQCILDNFWNQYINKRDDKGYMLSILNSLAEYFSTMNKKGPKPVNVETQELIPLYVLYNGNKPGIYLNYEEIISQKLEAERKNKDLLWRKYLDFNDALKYARSMIGENYYIEPKAKEFIENNIPTPPQPKYAKGEASGSKKSREEESPIYQSYKECLIKGMDPLDSEHIDMKIDEKMEEARNIIIGEIKEVVLRELRVELYERFHKLKKENNEKFDELKKENNENFDKLKKEYDEYKINHFLNDDGKYDVNMEDSQLPE